MNKLVIIPILMIFASLSVIPIVHAHCPLCTAAVGTGLIFTRYYGVDDSVVGIWIGAFAISTGLWIGKVLEKRYGNKIPMQKHVIAGLSLVLTIVSFYFGGLLGAQNSILGIDRLLFGTVAGSITSYAGLGLSTKIKQMNKGKVAFPYQTILTVIMFLVLTNIIFLVSL